MIKLLLSDEHTLTREGLKLLLGRSADIHVAAECRSPNEVRDRLAQERFDVLLVGVRTLGMTLELARDQPVVALGDNCEAEVVSQVLRLGAAGYLCRECPGEELAGVVRAVARGERLICGAAEPGRSPLDRLSPREVQVLRLLAMGESVEAAARALELSASTVRTYRQRLLEKIGGSERTALVRFAVRHGLIN